MASFRIDDAEVSRALASLQEHLSDPQPALVEAAQEAAEDARLNFIEQESPWGEGWEPLSGATLAQRRGESAQALRDTGALMNSITGQPSGDGAEFGAGVLYAATHQFGREGGGWNGSDIPARPFLPIRPDGTVDLPEETRDNFLDTLRSYISEGAQ